MLIVLNGVNNALYTHTLLTIHSAAGSLDRNVAKVNRMLQEMRVIAVDKQATQSKEEGGTIAGFGSHDIKFIFSTSCARRASY